MCELFALSSLAPTTVTLSLAEFARHGGATADNTDGWGIAFYDGPDLNLIRDPRPAHDSPWVAFTAAQRLRGIRWAQRRGDAGEARAEGKDLGPVGGLHHGMGKTQ